MQPLIHKAELSIASESLVVNVMPGESACLALNSDQSVSVFVFRPVRFPLSLLKKGILNIGNLQQHDALRLAPALKRGAALRVRVVEVEHAHVRKRKGATIFISIWGNPKDIEPSRLKYSIFSKSKINDTVQVRQR